MGRHSEAHSIRLQRPALAQERVWELEWELELESGSAVESETELAADLVQV